MSSWSNVIYLVLLVIFLILAIWKSLSRGEIRSAEGTVKKKKNPKFYWISIALLIILVLFSLVFIINSINFPFLSFPPIITIFSPSQKPSQPSVYRHLNIKEGDKIESPLVITGEVRGNWFFEGSFPVVLVNWDGLIIGEGLAKAKDDWMTTDFVPFHAELTFTKPENSTNQDYAKRGTIIFRKDNPSGLPEHDGTFELPIIFK